MAKGFKAGAGGGGAALNFKVVGNPQPESAKENTIWLNTDVPIGAWYFSATQPENLNEGDVWFPTGTSSLMEFNALKKNGIQVYPLKAQQYVDGALVDKTAKSYQGGEWVEWWYGQLYSNGNQWESITGGWTMVNATNATASLESGYINFTANAAASQGRQCAARTSEKITFPVDGYTKLKILADVISQVDSSGYPNIFGLTTSDKIPGTSTFTYYKTWSNIGNNQVFELDIGGANGDYYVSLVGVGVSKCYKVWLE